MGPNELAEWAPLQDDSLPLDSVRRGRYLFELIVAEHPTHAAHWVRRIDAIAAGLQVSCSCGTPYTLW